MTLRSFFIGRAIVFCCLIVIGIGFLTYEILFSNPKPVELTELPVEQITTPADAPTFVWNFKEADTLNPDGNPQTHVFLEVQYPNGVEMRQLLIATTDGSCNELYDTALDSVPGSANIQCYYAGLGYVFKITKGESAYLVQRKEFEEASPDYESAVTEFQTVYEIPFDGSSTN